MENLNTGHIDTAQEVASEPVIDLHQALSQTTEFKPPVEQKSGWDFSGEQQQEEKSGEDPGKGESSSESSAPRKGSERVSDEVKKASAETATEMFDQMLDMVGTFAVNHKFKKRFSAEEMKRVFDKDLEDKELSDVEEADQLLKKKFDRLLKQRDRKIKNIPLDVKEKQRCFTSFYNYFKVKDIAMPPEWLLGFTLGTIFIDRTIEVVSD